MKILAIRGKNLASLAHPFTLDFCQEPLLSTGIFAITGPTGAGKSTLLDALCLALYDETPRLALAPAKGNTLPDVTGETISPHDSRSLLRKGAAEGFAEVDFVANDGVAHRSRWSVRRARSKAGGKLQAVEMSLRRLADQQPVGGSLKSEVLTAIQACIGLNFSQFTRAVLLAQNEFAAFLKADDNERGLLLQTLTGTDVFSRLSVRAYQRAKQEQAALQQLQAQLGSVQPLTSTDRLKLETQRDAAKVQASQGEQRKRELEDHLRWHTAWVRAQTGEAQAIHAVQQATADHATAAPRRSYLQQVTAAQAVRPTLAVWERAERDWTSSQTTLTEARTRLNQTATALTQAEAATQQAALACEQAEQAQAAALPDIQQAQTLDTQIAMLLPRYAEAQQLVQVAQFEAAQAATEAQAREVQLRRTEAAVEPALHAAQAEAMRYQQTHAAAIQHHTHTTEVCQQALAALAMAAQHYARFDPETLAQHNQGLALQRDELASALALWRELAATGTQQAQAAADLQSLAAAIANHEALLAASTPEQTAAAQRLAQAERTAHLAAQACSPSVAELRACLEPATPCPVCGAHEHPYAHAANLQLRAVMEGLQAEAAHYKAAWETLLTQVSAQQTQLDSYRQQHAVTAQTVATLTQQYQQQQARWRHHPRYNPQQTAEAWADDLDRQWASNQADRAALTQVEQELRTATRHRDEAQHALDTAQRATTQAAAAVTAAQQAQQQAQQAAQTHTENLHQTLVTLGKECQALRLTWDQAALRLSQASERCETVADQLHALQNARQALLGGQTLADVTAKFHTTRVRTQQALTTQQTGQQQAANAHSRALEALRYTETTRTTRQAELAGAAAQLDAALATWGGGCDVPTLRTFLAYDTHWINREHQALQALITAMSNAATLETERRSACAALAQQRPNPDPAEVVQASLTQILAELASTQQQLTTHELALRLDDTRRQQLADMQTVLGQQMATTHTWEQLNELIGSATGNKFRNFAQQFSLDVLLAYANRHLADLSRRYVLQRVSDSLTLLVMDQDIGNELRSVHSLSGGESFLVSLALALGLAALSSCRVKVESLFIDEGFGSLDAEALRIAMEALDNLQAQGRKVGVISHVQEMTERIGVQIQVKRCAGSQSTVNVVA